MNKVPHISRLAMAGNRPEYDEDGSFGDFMFSAYPNSKALNNRPGNQIIAGDDDDDWGDFIDNSTLMNGGVGLSNGLFQTQSLSKLSGFAKPFDPFVVSVDRKEQHEPHASDLSRIDSGPSPSPKKHLEDRLLKPRGALPLSIFGEDKDRDEEDKSGADEPAFGGDANVFSNKNSGFENKLSGLNNGIGINDLIANLYDQGTKDKAENGLSTISSGAVLNSLGSNSDANGTVLNTSFQNWRGNGLDLNSNKLNSKFAVKNEVDDEDVGWEFKSAETEIQKEDRSYQKQGVAEGSGQDALESGNDPSESYGVLNWKSHKADDWNLGLESIPRARSQSNLTSDSYAESKLKKPVDGTTPVNGNFWELKDAFPKPRSGNISDAPILPVICSSSVEIIEVKSEGSHGLKNLLPESNKISAKSQALDFGFDSNACFQSLDTSDLDSIKTEQNDIVKGLSWSPIHENGNSDATFRTPEDSTTEIGQKLEGNHANLNILREALPESLFGIEKMQTNGSTECQTLSIYELAFNTSSEKTVGSKLSVNNLTSTLYNQAEETISANHTPTFRESERDSLATVLNPHLNGDNNAVDDSWDLKDASSGGAFYSRAEKGIHDTPKPSETGFQSSVLDNNFTSWELKDALSGTGSKLSSEVQPEVFNSADVVNSDLVNVEDDFSDDSWEFKNASSGTPNNDQTCDISLSVPSSVISIKSELSDYRNIFSKLIEELYYSSLNHLENLKKAQILAALSSGDSEADALDEEIKDISDALSQCEMISKQCQSADHAPRNLILHELVEIVKEPKYQLLESEYQLSSRLATAEKDFSCAVELLKHVASTVRILDLKSREEQSDYLTMWSKIVSVCSQELKHGAYIWKQSLLNHVNDLILSTHQGKQYIHALGEIFRVVEIIGASAKLYKPWILVGSGENRDLLASLNECCVIWSSSGLEDALKSVMVSLEKERAQMELFQSIKYIHDLDEPVMQNHAISPTLPKCRMSALPLDLLPGLKTVEWEGENYLLTLANLWANLISPQPPKS